MKKIVRLAAFCLAVAVLSPSCKKYEEGPGLSLRSKKARMAGEWKMSKWESVTVDTDTDGDATTTTTSSTDGSGVTRTVVTSSGGSSTTSTTSGTIETKSTIEKDGTYMTTQTTVYSGSEEIVGITVNWTNTTVEETSGTWNFTGGIGDAKKKEQVVFMPATRTTTTTNVSTPEGGSSTTTSTSESHTITGEQSVMTILLLKNKELHMKTEMTDAESNSSTSGGSSSTSSQSTKTTVDVTYVQ